MSVTCWQVLSADGAHQVAKITKQFGGMFKELYTNVDNFGLNCTWQAHVSVICLGIAEISED